jgi:hypothetical protein
VARERGDGEGRCGGKDTCKDLNDVFRVRVIRGKGYFLLGVIRGKGYFQNLNDVCRVGGFTTNSKPIVKILTYNIPLYVKEMHSRMVT